MKRIKMRRIRRSKAKEKLEAGGRVYLKTSFGFRQLVHIPAKGNNVIVFVKDPLDVVGTVVDARDNPFFIP